MLLGEAREIVEKTASEQHDDFFPASAISFENWDTVLINHKPFEVGRSAKRLLSVKLGVPAPYMDRCPKDLQATNLNYWLRQQDQRKPMFCRFSGDKLRAIFSDRYQPLDNKDVLSQITMDESTKVRFRMDEEMMALSIPDPNGRFAVAPGDEMLPGISVINSEVGLRAYCVEAFFLRLICTNGMISTEAVSKKFRHVSLRGVDGFHEAIHLLTEETRMLKGSAAVALTQNVPDPMRLIEKLGKRFVLSKKEIELVQGHYQGPDTMWQVVNAFTATAKDSGMSVDDQYRYERVGGQVLALCRQ